ncbi:hypothetical protein [Cognatishimia sp.]
MATIAQTVVKFPGFSVVRTVGQSVIAFLDKHSVEHWCEYMNKK